MMQEYKNGGKPVGKVKKIGTSDRCTAPSSLSSPTPRSFRTREFNWDTIVSHMRQQAYLVQGPAHFHPRPAQRER